MMKISDCQNRIANVTLIAIIYMVGLSKLYAQSDSLIFHNKHSFGISVLQIGESLKFKKALALTTIYSYNNTRKFSFNAALSLFKKGEDSYSEIFGGGGENFEIKGFQLKCGGRYITNYNTNHRKLYNFIGYGLAYSYYNIHHEIGIADVYGNLKFYPRDINLYAKSIDFQWGKIIKFSNKFHLVVYIDTWILSLSNVEVVPINKLPAIGYYTGSTGLFINGNIELFYNINK